MKTRANTSPNGGEEEALHAGIGGGTAEAVPCRNFSTSTHPLHNTQRMGHPSSISHDEALVRRLRKDPDFAAEYLKAALEDEAEPRVLLIALRRVAQARGIARVAKAAGVQRESLYRALSAHGNPRLSTLVAVAKAIGVRLTVKAA